MSKKSGCITLIGRLVLITGGVVGLGAVFKNANDESKKSWQDRVGGNATQEQSFVAPVTEDEILKQIRESKDDYIQALATRSGKHVLKQWIDIGQPSEYLDAYRERFSKYLEEHPNTKLKTEIIGLQNMVIEAYNKSIGFDPKTGSIGGRDMTIMER